MLCLLYSLLLPLLLSLPLPPLYDTSNRKEVYIYLDYEYEYTGICELEQCASRAIEGECNDIERFRKRLH